MPAEIFEKTGLKDRLQVAYAEKDCKKFLDALETIYCTLTECDGIPEEIENTLKMQLDPASAEIEGGTGFLNDPNKWDIEIPLAEGGDPHLTIYRDEDGLRLKLGGEVSRDLKMRFEALGFEK